MFEIIVASLIIGVFAWLFQNPIVFLVLIAVGVIWFFISVSY